MTVIDPAQDWTSLSRLYAGAETLLKFGGFECEIATDRITWTPGAYDLFDVARGSHVERRRIVDLYEETSRASLELLRAEAVRSGTGFSLDAQIKTTSGERRWMRLQTAVALADGRPIRLFGTKQDITREKQAWDRLRLRAERDALTGLANRDAFEHRLRGALADSEGLAALLIVDVDHFKSINDRFGHAVGDAVLVETAQRISRLFADALAIARIGGDEFAVLLSRPRDRDRIAALGARAVRRLKRPVPVKAQQVAISASVGVALVDGAQTRDGLFADADAALYAAKAAGRAACRIAGCDEDAAPSLRLA
jgi:diguanylate cyclase (GGDEF)-like protein